ncbi:MAG: hypothetical protein WC378_19615 [Opitutaceae bacterium]|jgi:hypothetical protein
MSDKRPAIVDAIEGFNTAMRRRAEAEHAAREAARNPKPKEAPVDPAELERRALARHVQEQEAKLRALVPKTWHMTGARGTRSDPLWIKGLDDLLSEQKQICHNDLQAVAIVANVALQQKWITREQWHTLDLKPPVCPEAEAARVQAAQEAQGWEAEWERIVGAVRAKGDKVGNRQAPLDALGLWNRAGRLKYDDDSLTKWRADLAAAGLL